MYDGFGWGHHLEIGFIHYRRKSSNTTGSHVLRKEVLHVHLSLILPALTYFILLKAKLMFQPVHSRYIWSSSELIG